MSVKRRAESSAGDCTNYEKGSSKDCKGSSVVCVSSGHFLITVLEKEVGLKARAHKTLEMSLVIGASVLCFFPSLTCLMKKIPNVCDVQ